jgi:hypothetical protein
VEPGLCRCCQSGPQQPRPQPLSLPSAAPPLPARSFSVLLLLPATAILEPAAFAQTHGLVAASPGFLVWLLVNSTMAYAVNLTNFMVTKYTSALTLQVGAGRGGGRRRRPVAVDPD